MKTSPLVSIIVPSFNQGQFIRETIESCLSQDYRPIEILIVDGASTDSTLAVLQDYNDTHEVNWISEPDSGVVEAVNKGFAMANGEIGAIQSSDDFYLPGAIRRGVNELQTHPACGFVYGDIIKVDETGSETMREVLKPFSVEAVLSSQTWIPQPSCFFRMSLAKTLGGWRESVPYAADTDLWYRMMLKAEVRKFDAFMSKRRQHGEQRDTQGEKITRDYTQVIEDWFDKSGAPPSLQPAADAGILLLKSRYGQPVANPMASAIERFPALVCLVSQPRSFKCLLNELLTHVKQRLLP